MSNDAGSLRPERDIDPSAQADTPVAASPRPGDAPRMAAVALPKTSGVERLRVLLFGRPRSIHDPHLFHKVSLVAFLAWVGLGADGLSSSAYGPEEAFKALGTHHYLAVVLALATALTVFVISYSYSKVIEHFPFGGGGYVVASRLLGARAGVVSGSALVIDYVLTITISISAGGDAIFSLLPATWFAWKLPLEIAALAMLVVTNLRGVKESVAVLTPVFITFLLTHAVLIVGVAASRAGELGAVAHEVKAGFHGGVAQLGFAGVLALLMRAYSMGGGTYTGIEAVSNGLMIMREPKVETGKRTMVLMAFSLALTAAGITLAYLLLHVAPAAGKTMNAVLVEAFAGGFEVSGVRIGAGFVLVTLASEALLLFVAAQAGFIDGPRVIANMASDSWLPRRFAQLSDRLTMQNGVVMMGAASLAALVYTHGDVSRLVVLYSINVFLTFSMSQLAMCRYWFRDRATRVDWKRQIAVHVVGLALCALILAMTVFEKFNEGGWLTLVLTGALVALCLGIRRHYRNVQRSLKRLDAALIGLPASGGAPAQPLDLRQPTAVLLVGGYGGLGVHSLLSIHRLFPGHFKNFLFVSIGVIDSATFKGVAAVEEVRARTRQALENYVAFARSHGMAADYRCEVGTEAVADAERLCIEIGREFPRSVFFAGKLVFERERWFQRLLHNETAYQLQRRLQFAGLDAMVLPVRVLAAPAAMAGAPSAGASAV